MKKAILLILMLGLAAYTGTCQTVPVAKVQQMAPTDSTAHKLAKAVQCSATTKAGKQCSRKTRNESGLCFQHDKKQAKK